MSLQARGLTVAIGEKTICHELDLDIRAGECWGVLGQNGAGKTTLLRALAGLHPSRGGGVFWDDAPLHTRPRREVARLIAMLLQQEAGEFWGSVLDYVLLGRFPHRAAWAGYGAEDERIASQALAQMELEFLASRPLNTLSGGERQRAAIAQLLAQQAQCCLLDEPLQHLDLRHQAAAMRTFSQCAKNGSAVVMVLHDPLWAQRCCDKLLLMFPDGSARCGTVDEMMTREHLEALYQCPLHEVAAGAGRSFVPSV
ncbi:MAG: ABC transporter ATP-binding protein [Gallionellaceae bacterium]|jgi:iron complex transport system ATP-binding protein|nr:ABC transporter ATP-binding protein [Gallionellaceae bacterium]